MIDLKKKIFNLFNSVILVILIFYIKYRLYMVNYTTQLTI